MNLPKSENAKQPQCPEEKEKAITKRVERYRDMSNTIAHLAVARELSPSVTSAFHGCLPESSTLFLLITVPSIVGVENSTLSPFVVRLVAGIPNLTL